MPTKTTTKPQARKPREAARKPAKSSSTRTRAAAKPAKASKTTEDKGVAPKADEQAATSRVEQPKMAPSDPAVTPTKSAFAPIAAKKQPPKPHQSRPRRRLSRRWKPFR